MKMRAITYLIIISAPGMVYGQKPPEGKDTLSFHRHSFSVETGVTIASTLKKGYIKPNPRIEPFSIATNNKYAGFTEKQSIGFHFALSYSNQLTKHLILKGSLSVFQKKQIFQSDSITLSVIEQNYSYIQFLKPYNIYYKYNDINMEIPFNIGYNFMRFTILAGGSILVCSYSNIKTIQYPQKIFTETKIMTSNFYKLFMNASLYYQSSNPKLMIFVAFDSGEMGYYYFQLGLKYLLFHSKAVTYVG